MDHSHIKGRGASTRRKSREPRRKEKTRLEQACEVIEEEHPEVRLKDTDGWNDVSSILQIYDEAEVKSHNENIDTLLVFAGLFSAILTAFALEAFKLLRRDASEMSMLILLQLSQQISSLTANPSSRNSTIIPVTISEFVPDTTSIWVNAMWFTALILSLITASLGMLVKQWLRAYLASTFVAPKERCEARWFRRTGLLRYRVPDIAAFLPLILQIALALFFTGLILFIAPIHIYIAASLAVVVSVWLLFLLVTTLIPVFSPACPYKAPCLEGPFKRFRNILETTFAKARYTTIGVYFKWNLRGKLFTEETDVWRIPLHEDKVLFDAYKTFKDSNIWEIVTRCIDLNNPFESIRKLSALFVSRRKEALLPWIFIGYDMEEADRRSLLKALVACFRKALSDVGNHSIFHHRHVDGLFILQEFGRSLTGSDESDHALSEIADHVLQEALSISDAVDFVAGSIVMALPKAENLPQMSSDVMLAVIHFATNYLRDYSGDIPLYYLLDLCRVVFVCGDRMPQGDHILLEDKFREFTNEIGKSLKSILTSNCFGYGNQYGSFKCHCVLNMAMMLHKRNPGLVNRSLFEVLHAGSLEMFDIAARYWGLARYIQQRPDGTATVATSSSQNLQSAIPDWEKILAGGEYVEVVVCGKGEYGDIWDYQRTRIDCKYRIEFMLNYPMCSYDLAEEFLAYQFS